MSLDALIQEARNFERSSGYRYGDKAAFSIYLADGLLLKGPNSAGAYLDSLGLTELPERVMVICPGNGGLVAECFRRGTKRVVVMEPRTRFHATLRRVLQLQESAWKAEEKTGLSHRLVMTWDQIRTNDGFKDVDLILWADGLEEMTQPKDVFQAVDSALNPGGRLFLEARLGRHPWIDKINSWFPSEHAIAEMSKEIFGGPWAAKSAGRFGQSSAVFTFVKPGEATKTSKVEKSKPAPVIAPTKAEMEETPAPAKKTRKKKAKKKAKRDEIKPEEDIVILTPDEEELLAGQEPTVGEGLTAEVEPLSLLDEAPELDTPEE